MSPHPDTVQTQHSEMVQTSSTGLTAAHRPSTLSSSRANRHRPPSFRLGVGAFVPRRTTPRHHSRDPLLPVQRPSPALSTPSPRVFVHQHSPHLVGTPTTSANANRTYPAWVRLSPADGRARFFDDAVARFDHSWKRKSSPRARRSRLVSKCIQCVVWGVAFVTTLSTCTFTKAKMTSRGTH